MAEFTRAKIISWRFRIQARGFVYLLLTLAVGAASALRGSNLFFIIFSTLAGIFVADAIFSVMSLLRLDIRRILPESATSNRPFQVGLRIKNGNRMIPLIGVRLDDRLFYEGRPAPLQPPTSLVGLCLARRKIRTAGSLTVYQRGWADFGPVTATCEFPPGLVSFQVVLDVPSRLLVLPREGIVSRRMLVPVLARAEHPILVASRASDGDDDPAGIREFRHGDNPKWIHWKLSARIPNRIYLREFEESSAREAVILLDSHLPQGGDPRRRSRQERAIAFGIALTEALLQEDYRVRFRFAHPEPTELTLESRPGEIEKLRQALALIKPSRDVTVEALARMNLPQRDETVFALLAGEESYEIPVPTSSLVRVHASEMRQYMYYTT